MPKIKKFEDIEAWEKARRIAKNVYAVCRQVEFFRDFGLRDQIQQAAVSIMSNIAEGFERGTNKEFIQFLFIAKGIGRGGSLPALCCSRPWIHQARYVRFPQFWLTFHIQADFRLHSISPIIFTKGQKR